MATVGQVIENPSMGARIQFRQVSSEADGELVEFDFYLKPGGIIAVDHLHPRQRESFDVVAGAVEGQVDGVPRMLVAGQTSSIEPGVVHGWRNASADETHLRVRFRPGLRSDEFFETVFALARAGRTNGLGVPRFPHNLAIIAAFSDEFRPAAMPRPLHWLVARLVKPFSGNLLKQYRPGAAT